MSSHTPTHEPEQDQARYGGQSFLDDYFVQLSEEDAASYDSALLKSRAFAHQKLSEHRTPGQARMEVLDEPDASVVYLITDDMPFLVDSVSAELVRQNLAIHLVTHPVFVVSRDKSTDVLTSVKKVP